MSASVAPLSCFCPPWLQAALPAIPPSPSIGTQSVPINVFNAGQYLVTVTPDGKLIAMPISVSSVLPQSSTPLPSPSLLLTPSPSPVDSGERESSFQQVQPDEEQTTTPIPSTAQLFDDEDVTFLSPSPSPVDSGGRGTTVQQLCLIATPVASTERRHFRPHDILPHPQVEQTGPREPAKNNKRLGYARCLTDSPEMKKAKEVHEEKLRKLEKQSSKKPSRSKDKVVAKDKVKNRSLVERTSKSKVYILTFQCIHFNLKM